MKEKIEYKQVKVNLKPEDHAKIKATADARDMTIAQYFRSLMDMKIEHAPAPIQQVAYKETDPILMYEIHKIGNNVNQIARYVNTKKILDRTVLDQLIAIERMLKDFL